MGPIFIAKRFHRCLMLNAAAFGDD